MNLECIVKRYYDELDQGRIMGRKCTACGSVEFPPRIACNTCGNFETEWVELTGKGQVLHLILPSKMAHPRIDELKPCAFASVKLEEGPEISALVLGITSENINDYRKRLPLPVEPVIIQRTGYKTLAFKIAENK